MTMMTMMSPDDALKVQVQIQALAIDVKRAQKQLARIEQGASASPQQKNTSKSLLDTLLDSDSEGEDSIEGIGQEDSGEGERVRNQVLSYFGENCISMVEGKYRKVPQPGCSSQILLVCACNLHSIRTSLFRCWKYCHEKKGKHDAGSC